MTLDELKQFATTRNIEVTHVYEGTRDYAVVGYCTHNGDTCQAVATCKKRGTKALAYRAFALQVDVVLRKHRIDLANCIRHH